MVSKAGEIAGRRGSAPKHRTVASALIEQIRAGRYRPGDLLPSEPELSRAFGVSRHTVRTALRTLYEKGLVLSHQGRGTIVQAAPLAPRYSHACDSVEDMLQYAAAIPRQVTAVERVTVEGALADWLGCEPGYVWWVAHTRRRQATDGPVVASSRIYVPELFGDVIETLGESAQPLFVLIEQRHGVHIAQIRQSISVATADAREAGDLDLDPGAPVMCVERRFIDERGGLLEVARTVHPPHAFRYDMTLRRVIGRGER